MSIEEKFNFKPSCHIEHYFQDWKKPTKEEQDYLEMCEGYRLPWSEEHPFIWEEEND